MITALTEKQVARAEGKVGQPLEYLRYILAESQPAFWKLAMFIPLAEHRSAASPEAYAIAKLVAARHEDCGSCVEINAKQAREAGVEADIIHNTLTGNVATLPAELADVYRFARAVVTQAPETDTLRAELEWQLGRKAMIDLAFALASTRVFTTLRRALEFGTHCSLADANV